VARNQAERIGDAEGDRRLTHTFKRGFTAPRRWAERPSRSGPSADARAGASLTPCHHRHRAWRDSKLSNDRDIVLGEHSARYSSSTLRRDSLAVPGCRGQHTMRSTPWGGEIDGTFLPLAGPIGDRDDPDSPSSSATSTAVGPSLPIGEPIGKRASTTSPRTARFAQAAAGAGEAAVRPFPAQRRCSRPREATDCRRGGNRE